MVPEYANTMEKPTGLLPMPTEVKNYIEAHVDSTLSGNNMDNMTNEQKIDFMRGIAEVDLDAQSSDKFPNQQAADLDKQMMPELLKMSFEKGLQGYTLTDADKAYEAKAEAAFKVDIDHIIDSKVKNLLQNLGYCSGSDCNQMNYILL